MEFLIESIPLVLRYNLNTILIAIKIKNYKIGIVESILTGSGSLYLRTNCQPYTSTPYNAKGSEKFDG